MKNKIILLALTTAFLAGCQKGNVSEYGRDDFSESSLTEETLNNDSYLMDPAPRYYIGNPYKVEDTQYIPMEDFSYNQTGIAGIIPAELNGRKTNNGEIFDVNQMVATSKTLPLPSIAKITNLENGNFVKVRINNRGPFINSRIMDVSPAVARKLDITEQAKVQVQILEEESRALKASTLGVSSPKTLTEEPLENTTSQNEESGEYTIQLAAFHSEDSAYALSNSMRKYGKTSVVKENDLYKVRIINIDSTKAKEIINTLRQNEGMTPGLIKSGRWINADSI